MAPNLNDIPRLLGAPAVSFVPKSRSALAVGVTPVAVVSLFPKGPELWLALAVDAARVVLPFPKFGLELEVDAVRIA
jgi:hypothetical protein